jgi:hypothetical protein
LAIATSVTVTAPPSFDWKKAAAVVSVSSSPVGKLASPSTSVRP